MTTKEMFSLRLLWQWLATLKVGDPVRIRWTNCYRYREAQGTISKINEHSVRVRITDAIMEDGKTAYPQGWELTAQLPKGKAMMRWTWNNTILPIDLNIITEQVDEKVAARYR